MHDIVMFGVYAVVAVVGLVLFAIGWTVTRIGWALARAWHARRKLYGAYHTAHPNERRYPNRW